MGQKVDKEIGFEQTLNQLDLTDIQNTPHNKRRIHIFKVFSFVVCMSFGFNDIYLASNIVLILGVQHNDLYIYILRNYYHNKFR